MNEKHDLYAAKVAIEEALRLLVARIASSIDAKLSKVVLQSGSDTLAVCVLVKDKSRLIVVKSYTGPGFRLLVWPTDEVSVCQRPLQLSRIEDQVEFLSSVGYYLREICRQAWEKESGLDLGLDDLAERLCVKL
jgi:D-alanine-D-alanine ligase-like ATP-grasp enzyme